MRNSQGRIYARYCQVFQSFLARCLHPARGRGGAVCGLQALADSRGAASGAGAAASAAAAVARRQYVQALWSLSYAIPEAQRETVLAQDVERFNRLPDRMPFQSTAAGYRRLPRWPSTAPARCTASTGGCLQRVREQPQAYADALVTQAALLARMRALADYADYRSPLRPRVDTPLPELPRMPLSMTASGLDFVQGRTTQALSGVCTDAQVGRVLMRSSDNLAITMIGAAMLRGNAQLFADMLAELPAQQSLPAHCAAAFAPATTQEISLCQALHGESRMVFSLLQDVRPPHDDRGWLERVAPQLLDRERTQALLAPTLTWACSAPLLAVLAQDRALPQDSVPVPETTSVACVANASGCLLASVSRPTTPITNTSCRTLPLHCARFRRCCGCAITPPTQRPWRSDLPRYRLCCVDRRAHCRSMAMASI